MKKFCKHCGAKLVPEEKHICPKLNWWKKVKNYFLSLLNYNDNDDRGIDFYERGQEIIPNAVTADNGEITVKQYDLAVLRTRHKLTRAEGRMQITNKRLLFRATGRSPAGKTTYQSEFAMDKIDGVEIRKDYRFLFWDFFINSWLASLTWSIGFLIGGLFVQNDRLFLEVLCLLLGLSTSVPFFVLKNKFRTKLLILSTGVGLVVPVLTLSAAFGRSAMIAFSVLIALILFIAYSISMFMSFFKPNLVVEIKTSGGTPGMHIKHRYASYFIWNKMEENSGFSEILPSKDAELATQEIGAIINDIKTLGDFGVEKWKSTQK